MLYRYGMLRNVTDICNSFLTQAGASQAHGTTMPKKGVNVHSANWSFNMLVLSRTFTKC